MIDGILLVDKEVGITSYDVIRRIKKDYPKGIKIGHTGTLDPFASGLLILLIGRPATKLMERFHKLEKEYVVEAQFGFETDTQDITGEIILRDGTKNKLTRRRIKSIVKDNFLGSISQLPPKYSAKKIKGKKAYDLARKNIDFELKPKDIHVSKFELLEYKYPNVKFKIVCSTGTYIRTLIKDLGNELDTYATATALRRTKIGNFSVDDIDSSIISVDKVLNMLNE
ncbi:MAG: tRNA pseudouridine(55) synthase TruB [Candidatus Dojkabacteria bacterium]|nr:tRNA pseudouridine(55) synthase TruB [Candidatus Dojkabacteria bacterium]